MSKIDLGQDCEKQSKNKCGRKHRRDMKLQELEKQLQFAESRCGTLKQQLDYIKRLYGAESNASSKDNGSFTSLRNGLGDGDADNVNFFNCANIMKNSNNLDSEAKNLYECDDEVGSDCRNRSSSLSKAKTFNFSARYKTKLGQDEKRTLNYAKAKPHLKLLKMNKKKNFKKFKGRKKPEEGNAVVNISSQSHTRVWQDPLVEIYKNSALKVESESGLEILCNGRRTRKGKDISFIVQKQRLDADNKADESKDEILNATPAGKMCNPVNVKKSPTVTQVPLEEELSAKNVTESIQTKQNEVTDFLKKDHFYFEQKKSYCQPTISSRKKQVDKDVYSCFRNINIKNIPFVAARSTAPSHNIGINIQQVLSIMKKKNPLSENFTGVSDMGNAENSLLTILAAKRGGLRNTFENEGFSEGSSQALGFSESKKKIEPIRTHLSHWSSNSDFNKEKEKVPEKVQESAKKKSDDDQDEDEWSVKVNKLKKVLVFLHEDFMSLSQKYKKLQKKLVKRNITTIEAKGELAEIEKDLEKKEEEITVVIGLYKEVLYLKENFKKLQDKYNLVTSGKILTPEGSQQTSSSSTHFQMQSLLRKIQNFQDRLKS